MNFKSTLIPGVRAFTWALRIKLQRERSSVVARSPFSSPCARPQAHLRAHWRVCPTSGLLAQRWSVDDSQDPQSRSIAQLFQQAGMIYTRHFGTCTFH